MKTARTVAAVASIAGAWKRGRERISVVPTMGALHEGHLALVRKSLKSADRTIVTLFVNPAQFNDARDLALYPRSEERDARLLEKEGVDLLFAPPAEEIYPAGFSTKISVSNVSEGLCGASRPGHFDGVATVVAKLLLITRADMAMFGEKDYQQLHVVRRLVGDLNIATEIVGHPTVRDADGLALSSRNLRLTAAQREIAPALAATLFRAAAEIADGACATDVLEAARRSLRQSGFDRVEYMEMRAQKDLRSLDGLTEAARLLAAAHLGEIRLIDNVAVAY